MLDILHIPLAAPSKPGQLDAANGPYVLAVLDRALAGCQSGEFAAMVTAPVHKASSTTRVSPFTSHTEYLAEKTATPLVVMMLAGNAERGPLRVALVTTHLPLKDVPAAITADVLEKPCVSCTPIYSTNMAWPGRASSSPALTRMLAKAVILAVRKSRSSRRCSTSCVAKGCYFRPHRPTPCSHRRCSPRNVAVLAMYHDQGLTALKYATFGQGINVTLGLPIIRTSVDHGTALALAGSGRADPGSSLKRLPKRPMHGRQKGLTRMKEHVARKRFGQNFLVDSGIIASHCFRHRAAKRPDARRDRPRFGGDYRATDGAPGSSACRRN